MPPAITPHERKIIELVAEGLLNKEIADKMCLSEQTIKNTIHSIFNKCGIFGQGRVRLVRQFYDLKEKK
jgi:DNA-binding NarL/FixJ family response regulator